MMQDEVNKIVFNALADGREIWFPGVGSLVPEFRSAWRASARQLERPSRRIAFLLSEQRGVSVIDLIARAGACDVAAAEDIYSRWLDKARVEDGISIPGVGEAQSPLLSARFAGSMPFSILSDTIRCR